MNDDQFQMAFFTGLLIFGTAFITLIVSSVVRGEICECKQIVEVVE